MTIPVTPQKNTANTTSVTINRVEKTLKNIIMFFISSMGPNTIKERIEPNVNVLAKEDAINASEVEQTERPKAKAIIAITDESGS